MFRIQGGFLRPTSTVFIIILSLLITLSILLPAHPTTASTVTCQVSEIAIFFTGVYPELQYDMLPEWLNITFSYQTCSNYLQDIGYITFQLPTDIQFYTTDSNSSDITVIHNSLLSSSLSLTGDKNPSPDPIPHASPFIDLVNNPYNCSTTSYNSFRPSGRFPGGRDEDSIYFITIPVTPERTTPFSPTTHYRAACKLNSLFYAPQNAVNSTTVSPQIINNATSEPIKYLSFPRFPAPITTEVYLFVQTTIGRTPPLYVPAYSMNTFVHRPVRLSFAGVPLSMTPRFHAVLGGFSPTQASFSFLAHTPIVVTNGYRPYLQATAPIVISECNITAVFNGIQRSYFVQPGDIYSTEIKYSTSSLSKNNQIVPGHHVIEVSNYIPFPPSDANTFISFDCNGRYYTPTSLDMLQSPTQIQQIYDTFFSLVLICRPPSCTTPSIVPQSPSPTFGGSTTLPILPLLTISTTYDSGCTAIDGEICYLLFHLDYSNSSLFKARYGGRPLFPLQDLDFTGISGNVHSVTFAPREEPVSSYNAQLNSWPFLPQPVEKWDYFANYTQTGIFWSFQAPDQLLQASDYDLRTLFTFKLSSEPISKLESCISDEFGHQFNRNWYNNYHLLPSLPRLWFQPIAENWYYFDQVPWWAPNTVLPDDSARRLGNIQFFQLWTQHQQSPLNNSNADPVYHLSLADGIADPSRKLFKCRVTMKSMLPRYLSFSPQVVKTRFNSIAEDKINGKLVNTTSTTIERSYNPQEYIFPPSPTEPDIVSLIPNNPPVIHNNITNTFFNRSVFAAHANRHNTTLRINGFTSQSDGVVVSAQTNLPIGSTPSIVNNFTLPMVYTNAVLIQVTLGRPSVLIPQSYQNVHSNLTASQTAPQSTDNQLHSSETPVSFSSLIPLSFRQFQSELMEVFIKTVNQGLKLGNISPNARAMPWSVTYGATQDEEITLTVVIPLSPVLSAWVASESLTVIENYIDGNAIFTPITVEQENNVQKKKFETLNLEPEQEPVKMTPYSRLKQRLENNRKKDNSTFVTSSVSHDKHHNIIKSHREIGAIRSNPKLGKNSLRQLFKKTINHHSSQTINTDFIDIDEFLRLERQFLSLNENDRIILNKASNNAAQAKLRQKYIAFAQQMTETIIPQLNSSSQIHATNNHTNNNNNAQFTPLFTRAHIRANHLSNQRRPKFSTQFTPSYTTQSSNDDSFAENTNITSTLPSFHELTHNIRRSFMSLIEVKNRLSILSTAPAQRDSNVDLGYAAIVLEKMYQTYEQERLEIENKLFQTIDNSSKIEYSDHNILQTKNQSNTTPSPTSLAAALYSTMQSSTTKSDRLSFSIHRALSSTTLPIYALNGLRDGTDTGIDCGGDNAPLCPSSCYSSLFNSPEHTTQMDFKQNDLVSKGNYNIKTATHINPLFSPKEHKKWYQGIVYYCQKDSDCVSGFCFPTHPFAIKNLYESPSRNFDTKVATVAGSARSPIQPHLPHGVTRDEAAAAGATIPNAYQVPISLFVTTQSRDVPTYGVCIHESYRGSSL